ncbi:response regulator transcription factor [Paenibacillus sp. BC26]|uniref:response regulator transcription factor n=1 Tax=Paenibacillus sp. BC26 TaxID=1881032 RepID=UPI0008EBCF5C|nr:response regulator transcription factor [Paenibacillus sp. BC26]SFT19319.1 DNA-binding response regulator, OmpR family, contains REC and winged-helix (wHTH) domain [Paenibacillus sp. BC26]
MKILIVEDEEAIRGFVRINLKRGGMEVTEAEDGETALALAQAASPPFDVALLDLMLPGISGFEVCEQLRQQFPRMGIIMLTAKSQEEDKIRGLELGADDYVQKPFSPGELVARLNALKRRMQPLGDEPAGGGDGAGGASAAEAAAMPAAAQAQPPQPQGSGGSAQGAAQQPVPQRPGELSSGLFRLSSAERRLWKDGVEIVLTPTEWTLVKLLMEREGEGLSRDDILNAVWGRHYVGDLKIVDVNIRRIRQKIEIQPSDPQHIETLWGYGYRWKRSDEQ